MESDEAIPARHYRPRRPGKGGPLRQRVMAILRKSVVGRRLRPRALTPASVNDVPERMRLKRVALLLATLVVSACDNASSPDPVKSLTIATPTPSPGSVIPLTLNGSQYFVARGSGLFSVPITVTSDRDVPWAQLYVYLYDGTPGLGYCGQNLPDAPTWGPFSKGQTVSVTISGWQVSRAPCQVTSIRAWLHTRNTGNLTPPTEAETVATGSLTVSYTFR